MESKGKARALAEALLIAKDGTPVPIEADGLEKKLFIGSVGAAKNMTAMNEAGITHVLCVARDIDPAFPDQFVYFKIEILDKPEEDIAEHFEAAVRFIEGAFEGNPNNKVLVHCFQGKSRSATVIAAYLMFKFQFNLEVTMDIIRKSRPNAQPNVGFGAQLNRWFKTCTGF